MTVRRSAVAPVVRLLPMNVLVKLTMGFLHHVNRLSLGIEKLLLLDGERVVVVGKDVLLLFVQLSLESGLLLIGVAPGRSLNR